MVDVLANGTLVIDFDGMPVELEKGFADLQDLQLAYACAHHPQNPGFRSSPAPWWWSKAHSFMHHRNLLYTG